MFSRPEATRSDKVTALQKQKNTQKKKKEKKKKNKQKNTKKTISEILHSKSHVCLSGKWHKLDMCTPKAVAEVLVHETLYRPTSQMCPLNKREFLLCDSSPMQTDRGAQGQNTTGPSRVCADNGHV